MARGGGGGGRGGGRSFGRSHHGRGRYGRQASIFEIIAVLVFGLFLTISNTGPRYSESALEAYSDGQYVQAFSHTVSYEDNLLLTFLVYEDRSDFSYMTWVGDHINDETFDLLRGEGTRLDSLLENHVQYDYSYSLSADLSRAIRDLADEIDAVTSNGSYTCTEDHSANPSYFVNDSGMALNEELLGDSIAYFTDTTGIPFVLVVEDAEEVFR